MATEKDVFADALNLPVSERARLAHELLVSLDEGADSGVDQAWIDEIERRALEVQQGSVPLEAWSTVRERLKSRWRAR